MIIESAFLCDDVRQEGNGKLLFIGAYSQDIIMQSFPVAMNLNAVLCVRMENDKPVNLEVEAIFDDKKMMSGKVTLNNIITGFAFLNFPVPLSLLNGPGILRVKVREQQERWKEAIKVEIKLASPATLNPISISSGSPQPS